MIPKAERQKIVWIRRPKTTRQASFGFTGDERAHVQAAVRFLTLRHGSRPKLASALGMPLRTLARVMQRRSEISAATVVRIARFAGTGVDALLAGKWPRKSMCPHCGRG